MLQQSINTDKANPRVLSGWISRGDLATELGVCVDTLGRWEARRTGPPCVRAGRKVLYRRAVVQRWLEDQENPPTSKKRGRK